jgi:endonuclease/exonuclease/phosphatase (EEP) superfamily protein YafD
MRAHREVSPPHLRRSSALSTVVAVATLIFAVATLIVRALPLSQIVDLVVAVGAPYTPLVALSGLVLATLSRRKILSLVGLLVLAATVAVQVPWYDFGRPADVGRHTEIRVLSSNLRKGQADPSSFVGLAKASADVITVSELTPEEVRRFNQAGLDNTFPYSLLFPAPGAIGIGLWSRYPLTVVSPTENPNIAAARVRVPQVGFDPLVASVHISSPVTRDTDSFDAWRRGITATKAGLHDFAEVTGPGAVIVAGDFNSTPDMRQFRDLLTEGYRDAVEQTGAGYGPTFPSNLDVPPFITIDHVLTRNAAASSIRTITMPGSDHRALLATIHVPVDPTAS